MRRTTHSLLVALLVVASLLPPLPAHAVGAVSIADTVAGLEALADVTGFSANANVALHVVSPSKADSAVPFRTDSKGSALLSLPSALTEEAGTYDAYVKSGQNVVARTGFTVLPGRMDTARSSIGTDADAIVPDGQAEVTVTVRLQDTYGNPLADRPVELISSRTEDILTPLTRETSADGEQSFTVRTDEPGEITLRAMDFLSGTMLQGEVRIRAQWNVSVGGDAPKRNPLVAQTSQPAGPSNPGNIRNSAFGALDHFEITLDPTKAKINEVLNLTIEAKDEDGNTVEDYAGSVKVYAPDDPGAGLPGFGEGHGQVQFAPKNLGRKFLPLSVSFSRPGVQQLVVIDEESPSQTIRGEATVEVTGTLEQTQVQPIQILSHPAGGQVTGESILLEGIGPVLANLEVSGGSQIALGETDSKGNFSILVKLDSSLNEYTLTVKNEKGTHEGSVTLVRDNKAPDILIGIEPEQPAQDAEVRVVAQSEPGLQSVLMEIANQRLTLSESASRPGEYDVIFRAPPPGKYTVIVTAMDGAGNETEAEETLLVQQRPLPAVQNLRVEAGFSEINLSWDALEGEEVSSYLVYVGGDPTNFGDKPLDTLEPRTSVTVKGLTPGDTVYAAVAAKSGERKGPIGESVSAVPLGLSLVVEPQDASLKLSWKYPESGVSEFLLEYGLEQKKLTEKRVVKGEVHMLRDLINGVTYYMKLTPISTTGELVSQMTVEAEGTPNGDAFHPSAEDPIPFKPGEVYVRPEQQPTLQLHDGASDTVEVGLPAIALGILSIVGIALFAFYHRRKKATQMTEEFLRAMQRQYNR